MYVISLVQTLFGSSTLNQPDYVVASIDGKKLVLNAFAQDGRLIDSYSIDKRKDMTSDKPWKSLDHPKLAIFGEMDAVSLHDPLWKDETWYVDPSSVSFDAVELASGELDINGKHIATQPGDVIRDAGITMISTRLLKEMGYIVSFHKELNVLSVEK